MKIIKTKINFKDKRGKIRDILTHVPVSSITYLSCSKNAVRGNHYHRKTIQYLYVLSGSFEVFSKRGLNGRVVRKIAKAGDLVFHDKNECHAFKALEFSTMLSFNEGVRRGKDYEKDTYRLEKPMI